MIKLSLDSPTHEINGVGDVMAKKLKSLGIVTVRDLLEYFPLRYEDFSNITKTSDVEPGAVTVRGVLENITGRYVRRGMHITEAVFRDESGTIRAVWFNQPYRANGMKVGQEYFVSGDYNLSQQRFQMTSPSAELVKDFQLNTARIVPIYRQAKGLTSLQIRRMIGSCQNLIVSLPETLPTWMVDDNKLLPRRDAVQAIHYPESMEQMTEARRRLGFDEVFELSLASLLNRAENAAEHSFLVPFEAAVAKSFVSSLPFDLTDDQRRVIWQIYQDMQADRPMNRLLEGDVGSGKTVVAAMAAVMAIKAGYQVAIMAPTEILARQHLATLSKLLPFDIEIQLLIGSLKPKQKQEVYGLVESGKANLIVGTHALIQEKVSLKNLSLIVIDEQHRFGVEQRKALMKKAGHMPHVLSMTATPIPRSLALTLYGEMDISILKQKPAGRQPIETAITEFSQRQLLYDGLIDQVRAGAQMYVVCPLVLESGSGAAKSAEKVHTELVKRYGKDVSIGLLHGRQKAEEKDEIMQSFASGQTKVLVSTTVIEVGVDVPNASLMVIESADRFGLAQLHQLRGRIGRGDKASSCYLLLDENSAPTKRLRAVATSNDGFKLAEYDLQLRGAGAIYGARQHGALDLRIAKLTDVVLISEARGAAKEFVKRGEDLLQYTEVSERVSVLRKITHLN